MKAKVTEQLRQHFRPELLNRIDEIIVFHALNQRADQADRGPAARKHAQRQLADRKLHLEVTDAAKELIADSGFDPLYGARPLRRTIQRMVENPISVRHPAPRVQRRRHHRRRQRRRKDRHPQARRAPDGCCRLTDTKTARRSCPAGRSLSLTLQSHMARRAVIGVTHRAFEAIPGPRLAAFPVAARIAFNAVPVLLLVAAVTGQAVAVAVRGVIFVVGRARSRVVGR